MIDKKKLAHASKFYVDEYGESRIDMPFSDYEKLITPPTQEEVCAKLSEYYGKKVVIYVKDVKKFAYFSNVFNGYEEICFLEETLGSMNSVRFSLPLPLHIASDIIKFYEG